MMSPDEKPYEVGYGRPPKHTRFRPGQSGNPKGRGKGVLNLRTIVEREFNELVAVTDNGRRRKVRKVELMFKTALNRAIKGDARALNAMIAISQRLNIGFGDLDHEVEDFSAYDAEMLARFVEDSRPEANADDA